MNDPLTYATLGLAYCVAFLLVGFRWPVVAMTLVIAGAPIQNNLSAGGAEASHFAAAGNFSIAELNLALTAVILLGKLSAGKRTMVIGPTVLPAVLYLAVCLLSSLDRWEGDTTSLAYLQMVQYLLLAVIVFGSLPASDRECRIAFYALVVVGTALAIVVATAPTNYILGLHKNGLGDSLAAALIVGVELWISEEKGNVRLLLMAATGVLTLGLVTSLSRGAWLGAMAGTVVVALMRRRRSLLLNAACVLAAVAFAGWSLLPLESQNIALDLNPVSYNVRARIRSIEFARENFEKDPLLGQGIALRKRRDATNLLWFTLAETGVLGVAALAILHLSVARMAVVGARRFSESDSGFSLLVIAAALVALKLVHGMVDHYWTRGSVMCAWAAVGMASRVWRRHESLRSVVMSGTRRELLGLVS